MPGKKKQQPIKKKPAAKPVTLKKQKKEIVFGRVTLTQRAIFARNLSVMLKAGLTIVDALEIAHEAATGKFKRILRSVHASIQAGRPLSEAFMQYPKVFSGLFINSTKAGESSGNLEENLEHIAVQLEKEKELVSKVKGAMLYPVVVLSATFVLGLVLSFLVLPKIIPLFEGLGAELPFTTRMLISFSQIVEAHGVKLFLSVVGGVVFLIWLLRQKFMRPVTHWVLLSTPIIRRIVHSSNVARFCRTLGTLLASGIIIDEALSITADTMSNMYFRRALEQISAHIGKGTKLSNELVQYENLFPVMVVRMVRVGEESGKLDETLVHLAQFFEQEVDTATKSLSTAIEPMLLLFIGLGVGFLALSIITPIYNITGNISR